MFVQCVTGRKHPAQRWHSSHPYLEPTVDPHPCRLSRTSLQKLAPLSCVIFFFLTLGCISPHQHISVRWRPLTGFVVNYPHPLPICSLCSPPTPHKLQLQSSGCSESQGHLAHTIGKSWWPRPRIKSKNLTSVPHIVPPARGSPLDHNQVMSIPCSFPPDDLH